MGVHKGWEEGAVGGQWRADVMEGWKVDRDAG